MCSLVPKATSSQEQSVLHAHHHVNLVLDMRNVSFVRKVIICTRENVSMLVQLAPMKNKMSVNLVIAYA